MLLLLRRFVFFACCLGLAAYRPAASAPRVPADTSAHRALQACVAGHCEAVLAVLERLFEKDAAAFEGEGGSVAYWLGSVYLTQERAEAAASVWETGLEALRRAGHFDADLADAFIRHVIGTGDAARYGAAGAAYLDLLASLDWDAPPHARTVVARHLVPLALILPPGLQAETGLRPAGAVLEGLKPGAGQALVRWWRSQDAMPATRVHERLVEHLQRVAYALRHYGREDDPARYDDRGAVYIRLGAPSRTAQVQLNDLRYGHDFFAFAHLLSRFPENAFWVYKQVGYDAQYLFVRRRGVGFVLGEPLDLLPRELQAGLGSSERGTRKAEMLLRMMEEVYGQLALYHAHYGSRYTSLADYVEQLEAVGYQEQAAQLAAAMQPPEEDETGTGEEQERPALRMRAFAPSRPLQSRLSLQSGSFAQAALVQARAEAREAARRREATVPPSYSEVYRPDAPLPVALRWARFLDPDGTTRTEVYWTLAAAALAPSEKQLKRLEKAGHEPYEHYLLQLRAVQQSADFVSRAVHFEHYALAAGARPPGAVLPLQQFVARGDTATFHLALQWNAHWAARDRAGQVEAGPLLKVGAYRVDSLQGLRSDEGRLEMSDLKPLRLGAQAAAEPALEAAAPYPYAALTPGTPLALYFELYHLAFGSDDRTHYRVAYEVARSEARGGLLQLLGGRTTEQTGSQTPYTGNSRTAREYVVLDLQDWQGEGELEVTVRVTDETTGQEVARQIRFELLAAE